MINRSAVLLSTLPLLLVGAPCARAQDSSHTLVLKADGLGAGTGLIGIYWKTDLLDETVPNVGRQLQTFPVPRKYYVGTVTRPGATRHLWDFKANFLTQANLTDGLTLRRTAEPPFCMHPSTIREKGNRVLTDPSAPSLLSGIIWFGHMYQICQAADNKAGAAASDEMIRKFYVALENNSNHTFVGCRTNPTDGRCA